MLDSFTSRGRVRNILKLLAKERKIILKGPLSDLNRLATRRDKMVEGLTDSKTSLGEADIKAIRKAANRNKGLLKASLSGIHAAKTLLLEQHQVATTMGTYTDSGERLEAPQSSDLNGRKV